MDALLSHAAAPTGRVSSHQESSHLKTQHLLAPEDRHHLVYLGLGLCGAGFLLPYHSLVLSVDYFHTVFPGSSIVFDISLIYVLTAVVAVLLSTGLTQVLSLTTRILLGYLLSLLVLLFLLVAVVWLELLEQEQSYGAVLGCVALVALGATLQQSSFYGLTGMLPARYTQAVMVGESAAGLLAALARLATKALVTSPRAATALFFIFSTLVILTCVFVFLRVQASHLVRFYRAACTKQRMVLRLQVRSGPVSGLSS